jgi:starch synthase
VSRPLDPPERKSLSVALLTREYPPEVYGGAGVHVEHLAAALEREAIEVAVCCFGAPRPDPRVRASIRPWEALPDTPEGAALRALSADLALAAAAEGVDVVHSHTWYANLGGHLASLLWGCPHVVTCHSLEPLRPWKAEALGGGYAVSCWAERVALEAADAVIAVSGGMRDDVLACYPAVDPDRVTVIHNGIDPGVYAPDPGTDTLERRGIDPDRPYVMWIGRVTHQKGITHLLHAARSLDPAAALVLCAGAPDTPEIAAEVGHAVATLQSERDGVHWIDGMLERAEVVQLLSHAAVFVCPSIYEPFGLINLEAMACETPVVAGAVGGVPEIVLDGTTGLLVGWDPDHPVRYRAGLADAINRLLAEPATATAMGKAGRRRVLEHFTWSAVAAATARLYRRLA